MMQQLVLVPEDKPGKDVGKDAGKDAGKRDTDKDVAALRDIAPAMEHLAKSIEVAPANIARETHAVTMAFVVGLLVGIVLSLLFVNLREKRA